MDNRFKSAYSKALAEALLANELEQKQKNKERRQQQHNKANNANDVSESNHNASCTRKQAEDAYKELCFDYPLLPPFEQSSALALHLIQKHSRNNNNTNNNDDNMDVMEETLQKLKLNSNGDYRNQDEKFTLALSNRFISGVIETTTNSTPVVASAATAATASSNYPSGLNKNRNNTSNAKQDNSNDDDTYNVDSYESYLKEPIVPSKDETYDVTTHRYTNAQGCNLLAFVAFAFGPLQCIHTLKKLSSLKQQTNQNNHLTVEQMTLFNSIHSFLGSYVCHDTTTTSNPTSTLHETNHNAVNDLLSSMHQMNILSSNTNATETTETTTSSSSGTNDHPSSSFEEKNPTNDDLHSNNNNNDDEEGVEDDHINDHDSMQEIWAEESDPDDYDYGNDRYANYNNNNNHEDNDNDTHNNDIHENSTTSFAFIDPITLSKKQKHRSIQSIIECVQSLLQQLSFHKLQHLTKSSSSSSTVAATSSSSTLWYKWNITQVLTNLTLTLLQCTETITQSLSNHDNNDDNNIDVMMTQHLSMLYMKPFMVLRDRALEERLMYDGTTTCSSGSISTAMDDYLSLLHILLQSKEKHVGLYASQNIIPPMNDDATAILHKQLSPARNIGLSSLAALCTTLLSETGSSKPSSSNHRLNHELYNTIRTALMKSVDEFIDCIEFIRPNRKDKKNHPVLNVSKNNESGNDLVEGQSSVPSWVRVTMAFLPILDFMTGINSRSDFSLMETTTSISYTAQRQLESKKTDSQTILQSGLFRELILLYSTTATNTNHDNDTKEKKSSDLLSAQEMIRLKLLRSILVMSSQAPSTLGKYVARVPEFTQILYSDTFMECHRVDAILWFAFLYHVGSGAAPQMRMKGSTTLSTTEMRDRCVHCTIELLKSVVHTLGNEHEHQSTHPLNTDDVYDYLSLTGCLTRVQSLMQPWVYTNASHEKEIQELLCKVVKCLRDIKPDQLGKDKAGGNDSESGKKKEDSKTAKDCLKQNRILIDRIRSSSKFILMTMEEEYLRGSQSSAIGSNSVRPTSSKND